MNVYSFIVITVISIYSTARPIDVEWPNVGTVLFSNKDLRRKVWPKADIALLEARRHFQHMIPPPELVNPSYNFVDSLIDYFKQSYTSIKNTASNPEEDSILTTALSDIIGGYLKLWIIPTTKFAYYSGSISQDQAFKVFSFYDEIRKYLQTDGSGWRSPDNKILKAIVQNIPQKAPQNHVRSPNSDPCEIFAYFEKTPDGFTIPLPYINWEQSTMFVPLKNQSLVHLGSSQYSNVLVNYYTAAKSCLQRRNPNITNQFDKKVQSWLSQMVLPHLTDDPLYVALGNVLMLFNDKEFPNSNCPWEDSLSLSVPPPLTIPDSGTNVCSLKCKIKYFFKEVLKKVTNLFVYMWHHKIITLVCLLLLEFLWCMCAMNCLKVEIKNNPFCICKRVKKFFSDLKSDMPGDEEDNDDKGDSKKQKSKEKKKKKRCNLFGSSGSDKGKKKKEKSKSSTTTDKDKKKKGISNESSSSDEALEGKKGKNKKKANKADTSFDEALESKKGKKEKKTKKVDTSSDEASEDKKGKKEKKTKKVDTSSDEAEDKKGKNAKKTNKTDTSSDTSKGKKRRGCKISCCKSKSGPDKKKGKKEKPDQKIVKKLKDDLVRDESTSTSTPQSIDDLKCHEACKPCHSADTSLADNRTKLMTDKPILQEKTAEKATQDTVSSQSSDQQCSAPCSIKASELEQILNCPEKDTTDYSKNSSSGSKSSQCKSDESVQNKAMTDTYSKNEKKICHMRTVDVKYPEELNPSSKELDINSKTRRRTDKNYTPLSKQQTHFSYSSVDSGSKSFDSCVYDVIKEVSSRSKSILTSNYAQQRKKSKKNYKSDITEKKLCTSKDQDNIVTLFQNESPIKKTLSRCVSIKTPFSTLHESASSLQSKYSLVNQTEKYPLNISQTDRKTGHTPKMHMSSKIDTEQKSEMITNLPLKQKTYEKLRISKTVSHIKASRADELMRDDSKLERARSRHKYVQEGHDRIIAYKDMKEVNKEPTREESKVTKEVRRKLKEMKHTPKSHERNVITDNQKINESVLENKKSVISNEKGTREQGLKSLEKQQEILPETINKDLKDRNLLKELKRSSAYLAIKIDRPDTEINVGLTGTMMGRIDRSTKNIITQEDNTYEKKKEEHVRVERESKIPKRATRGSHSRSPNPEREHPQSSAAKPKSKIPQPKKRAADDIAINVKTPSGKLNVTL